MVDIQLYGGPRDGQVVSVPGSLPPTILVPAVNLTTIFEEAVIDPESIIEVLTYYRRGTKYVYEGVK